jgi:hypothetical protein
MVLMREIVSTWRAAHPIATFSTTASIQIAVLWDVAMCSLAEIYRQRNLPHPSSGENNSGCAFFKADHFPKVGKYLHDTSASCP